jgi:hypothetical protein
VLSTAIVLSAAAAAQDSEPRFSTAARVSLGWEDNIALMAAENDKIDATTTELAVALGYKLVQTPDLEIAASLTPFYEWVSDVGDLSNYGATLGVDLRGAFGREFTDPWYSIGLDYTLAEFKDSDPRDGDWIELELAAGKQFSPRFGISGGYRYLQRWQDDSNPECVTAGCAPQFNWQTDEVFDLEKHGAFVHADLFLLESTDLFVEYSYWNGDVAVAGRPAAPNAVVVDDLALEGFRNPNGSQGEFRVWRADADQHVVELGGTRRFSERFSVEVSALYLWTTDVNNIISENDYENTVVTLSATFEM